MTSKIKSEILALLIVIIIPMSLLIPYYADKEIYPRADSGHYTLHALSLYQEYKVNGFTEAIMQNWQNPAAKFILHPLLLLVALILLNGKVLLSIAVTMLLIYGIFLIYFFLFCRIYMNKVSATLLALVVGMSPWMLRSASEPLSELPFLMASIIAIYHFIKSNTWKNRTHTILAGIFLGLSVCFRPIEALGTLGPAFVVWSLYALKEKQIALKDFIPWIFQITCISTLIFFKNSYLVPPVANQTVIFMHMVSVLLFCALIFMIKLFKLNQNFQLFFSISFFLYFFWFSPAIYQLVYWAYECSFGEMVQWSPKLGGDTLQSYLRYYFKNMGFVAVLFSLLAVLFSCNEISKKINSKIIRNTIVVFCICILPTLMGMLSLSSDTRYFYFGWVFLIFTSGALLFRINGIFRKITYTIVFIMLGFNYAIANEYLLKDAGVFERVAFFGRENFLAPSSNPEFTIPMYQQIKKYFRYKKRVNFEIIYKDGDERRFLAPEYLEMRSLEEGYDILFRVFDNYGDEYSRGTKSLDDTLFLHANNYDYFIYGPIEGVMPQINNERVLRLYKLFESTNESDFLLKNGISFVEKSCINFDEKEICVKIYKTNKKD